MKKALQISLARTLFTIEEDAYAALDAYLRSIRVHFAHTEGKDEIIGDIEGRMSEQFLETGKNIITFQEVEAVMISMGKVEDFERDTEEGEATSSSTTDTNNAKKKFYRNPDDKIIAGVCSGIAAYLNVDVLWVRVSFVVLTIVTNGFGIIAYILLAVLTPEAKSSSQKLEMVGNPVTLATMSENVKEKIETVRTEHGSTIRNIIAWPFAMLKKIIDGLGPILRVLTGIAFAVLSLGSILALSFLAPLILMHGNEFLDFPLTDIVAFPVLLMTIIGAYVALVIPLAILFLLAIGFATKKRIVRSTLGFTLLFFWCIGVVVGAIGAFNTGNSLEQYTRDTPLYETSTREVAITDQVTALHIKKGIHVTYVQGDTSSLIMTGRTRTLNDISVEENEGVLTVAMNEHEYFCLFCYSGDVEVTVVLPTLEAIQATSGSRITTASWTSIVPVVIELAQGSRGDITIHAEKIEAIVRHGSRLTLYGASERAILSATHGSRITTMEADLAIVTANAGQGSHVLLGTVDTLEALAESGATIDYYEVEQLIEQTNGGGTIERRLYNMETR